MYSIQTNESHKKLIKNKLGIFFIICYKAYINKMKNAWLISEDLSENLSVNPSYLISIIGIALLSSAILKKLV